MITIVSQEEKDTSIFFHNAISSLVKAIAFRSLAIQSLNSKERINATVSAYYSLLHLSIALIYFCPDKADKRLLNKLRNKRGDGDIDPSSKIRHEDAIKFVESCIQHGLDKKLYNQLELAKGLREFVNYGPRLTIIDGQPNFGPCEDQPFDCDRLVSVLTKLFPLALNWAYMNNSPDENMVKLAFEHCPDFFCHSDLFYTQWCSEQCIKISLEFVNELKQNVGIYEPLLFHDYSELTIKNAD